MQQNKRLAIIKITQTIIIIFICFHSYGQNKIDEGEIVDYNQYKKDQSIKYSEKKFEQIQLKTSDSTIFSNADLLNKVVFVNFWFESCVPCIAELEGLNKLFDTLKDNKNFIFISFTFEPELTIEKLKNKYNIKYKIFHIERTECYRLNMYNGFPTSFILDKKNKIKYSKFGGLIDKEQATNEIITDIYPKIVEQLLYATK